MATLVLTVIADDRPGLVSALSALVSARGGSWERGQLTHLAGKFAGVVLVTVPDARLEELEDDLRALAAQGLQVRVDPGDPVDLADPADAPQRLTLEVVGNDRPGIVAEISRAVAGCGMGIEEIDTALREAPHAAVPLFELSAVLTVPTDGDVEALRTALEGIAVDLMVDVALS